MDFDSSELPRCGKGTRLLTVKSSIWLLILKAFCSSLTIVCADLDPAVAEQGYRLVADAHALQRKTANLLHHHHLEREIDLGEFEIGLGFDSRYVSEGRDNLSGQSGIIWGKVGGHTHAAGGTFFTELLTIEAWGKAYNETNVSVGYEYEEGSASIGGALTYLDFPTDGENDLEANLNARWKWGATGGFTTDWAWSEKSGGWFGETSAFHEIAVNQNWTLTTMAFLGANKGYVVEEHDGLNYLGLRIETVVALTEHLKCAFYIAAIEPLGRESGESLRNLLWAGGALTFAF